MVKSVSFLGLDYAGKTSIITAITKRFGFEETVLNLKPTRRIARDVFKFLGLEITRMDFGGQAQYREEYLSQPNKYLAGIDLIFYVIDVQDHERYVETIDYIDKILLFFKENVELNKRVLTIKQALMKYSNDFDLFFFETTIYDIKSLMDAFSSGLYLLFDKMELVSNLFAEISRNYNALLIALYDVKGITIGEYYKPHLQLKEKIRIYEKYLEVQKKIIKEDKSLHEFSDKFEDGKRYSGVVEVLTLNNLDFYLLFIIEEDEKNLGKTVELLDKIEAAKPQMEQLIFQIIQ
ncbi:MAG: ADP-ribosylation factor-like protein [Promethearchaeota archaeon]